MRILNLKAENVKRIRAIDITPEGHVVEIAGRNGQGKTSVLDSIVWAIGGKPNAPKPVRNGAETAEIVATIGESEPEYIVRRHWTSKGDSYLTVDRPDGSRMKSPQQILDGLFSALAFDPLEFTRMKPAQQADTLRALVGLDLAAFDGKRQRLYDERREVGRVGAEVKGQLSGIPEPAEDLPAERVSIANEISARAALTERMREAESAGQMAQQHRYHARVCAEQIAEMRKKIAELEAAIESHNHEADRLDAEVASNPVSAIRKQVEDADVRIANAEQTNRAIDAREQREKVAARMEELRAKYEDLTKQIEAIDAEKAAAIAAAKFPLEGLGIDGQVVTLNGIPFEQLSQAEQIRASVAIVMAMKPKLRVGLVHDGSLLDDDSMKALASAAEEHGFQVWVERVGSQGQVVIEDGAVVGAEGPR